MQKISCAIDEEMLAALHDFHTKATKGPKRSFSSTLRLVLWFGLRSKGYVLRDEYETDGILPQLVEQYGEGAELPPFVRMEETK